MTQLTYQLDRRFPIAVIRLSGDLTAENAPAVGAAVREALVEEPTSVIVDCAQVPRADDTAAAAFPRLAAQAAEWPGAALLVCGAGREVTAVLRRSAQDGTGAVYASFEEALSVAAAQPVPQRMHRRLESTVHAPRAARELAIDACTEWDLPGSVIPTEIIASELVTNAVRHAGTVLDLRVTLQGDRLRISVQDRSARMARLRTPAGVDDHGRGLLIVGSVAAAWGSEPVAGGKVVWASLRTARAGGRAPASRRSPGSSGSSGADSSESGAGETRARSGEPPRGRPPTPDPAG